jgi:hypothetical protein
MATKKVPRGAFRFDLAGTDLAIKAATDGGDAQVSGVAYGGGVMNHPWWGRIVIDLEGANVRNPLTLLYGHDSRSEIGQASDVSVTHQVEIKSGVIYQVTDESKKIVQLAAKGFKWAWSLGTQPKWIDEIPPDVTVTVNGQQLQGPLMIARQSEIFESSITSIPVDGSTSAQVFSNDSTDQIEIEIRKGAHDMSKTVEQLQADLDKVNAEIATRELELKAATDAANAKIEGAMAENKKLKDGIRETAVKSMFVATGMEFSAESAKQYMSMTDEQFCAVSADMTKTRPKPDPAFFKAAVVPGSDSLAGESQEGVPAQILAARKIAADLVAACTHKAVIKAVH